MTGFIMEFMVVDVEKCRSDIILFRLIFRIVISTLIAVLLLGVSEKMNFSFNLFLFPSFVLFICWILLSYATDMLFFTSFHIKYFIDVNNKELEILFYSGEQKKVDLSSYILWYPTKGGGEIELISDLDKNHFNINRKIKDYKKFVLLLEKCVKKVNGSIDSI